MSEMDAKGSTGGFDAVVKNRIRKQTADERLAWKDVCTCGHVRIAHCYGCGGDTLKGAVWHHCKCTTFKLAYVKTGKEEYDRKHRTHQIFGRHCQSREGMVQK
jgi:hypothetical protein